MRNALINNPDTARYFVVEPLYDPAVVSDVMTTTEIAAPLGRDWHCLKIVFTPTNQIQMSIYNPIMPGGPYDYFRTSIEMPYDQVANLPIIADYLTKATAELSDELYSAFFREGIGEAQYFWKPKTSVEDWALPQFTPAKQWHEFIFDEHGNDDVTYREKDRGSDTTHYRLELVLPKPWHKELKRSMRLWVPGSKIPRRYNISKAETREDLDKKLKKSGFNIKLPWSMRDKLSDWPYTFVRFWLH